MEMRSVVRRRRLIALGALAVVSSWAASAVHARDLAPEEFQALSPMCQAMLGDKGSRKERMREFSQLLPGTCGVHHTCYGELAMIRYKRAALKKPLSSDNYKQAVYKRNLRFLLQTAAQEYSYEIRCAPPTYPLLPMIHTERGKALSLAGKHAEAVKDFSRALELDPNYAPARQALALAQSRVITPKSSK